MTDPMEVAEILRQRLEPYAFPNSFSFAFDTKRADLQCVVENGETVEVRLTPARRTLVMAFSGRRTGVRVSLKVEETTGKRSSRRSCPRSRRCCRRGRDAGRTDLGGTRNDLRPGPQNISGAHRSHAIAAVRPVRWTKREQKDRRKELRETLDRRRAAGGV